jgi:hypothetical protein
VKSRLAQQFGPGATDVVERSLRNFDHETALKALRALRVQKAA